MREQVLVQNHAAEGHSLVWGNAHSAKRRRRKAGGSPHGPLVPTAFQCRRHSSMPGQGPKIPQASQPKDQDAEKEQYCNQLAKIF